MVAEHIQEVRKVAGPPYKAAGGVDAVVVVAVVGGVDVDVDVVVHTDIVPKAAAQPSQTDLTLDKWEEWACK